MVNAYLYHHVNGEWVYHSSAGRMTGDDMLMLNLVLKDGWMIFEHMQGR